MNFVSHRRLLEDVRGWANQLPEDLVAVAGVPRSGLLPATLLALHRNLHLVSLDELIRGEQPWQMPLRRGVPARQTGRVLVVDDTVNTGGTIGQVRREIGERDDVLFGAVYFAERVPEVVDAAFRSVPQARCFEWNVFHSDYMRVSCLDMDGVICEDWTDFETDDEAGRQRYRHHLQQACPRHVPTYPVMAIVTSRLERYRTDTVNWLRNQGVRFEELVMSPYCSARQRQEAGDHARRKAACYAGLASARLFVESDANQANQIASLSQRPVLCTDTMELARGPISPTTQRLTS